MKKAWPDSPGFTVIGLTGGGLPVASGPLPGFFGLGSCAYGVYERFWPVWGFKNADTLSKKIVFGRNRAVLRL